jgi:predicted PurR-regulated permease PerM
MEKTLGGIRSQVQILQLVVYGGVVLYFGRNIFVPIGFAVLISFILYPLCAWMEKKGIGRLAAILISLIGLVVLLLFLIALLLKQFMGFLQEWPSLQSKLLATLKEISSLVTSFGISEEKQNTWIANIADQSGGKALQIFGDIIVGSTFSLVLLVLVPVYVVLILYYRHYWVNIVYKLFPHEKRDSLREIISLTIKAYYNFIKGMGFVYLTVGTLNSIGLLLLGVPHAVLFGFIASILTFVPYVGIIVGSLLPITMAWITYDSIWYPVGIILIFTFVQYLEANIIFPLAVSYRLSVNTLAMLLAIFVGGLLWGMAGMMLFVPFVGIAKLIADHNPKWKTVSLILGTDGKA